MKTIKFTIFALICVSILWLISPVFANTAYLEAKDYIDLTKDDVQNEVQTFLGTCKTKNKAAFFNSGTYRFKTNLELVDGVSIIGDKNTIFRGENSSSQINIFDDNGVSNIKIENIVFDNMTIYGRNSISTNWEIKNNIFMNAKAVDTLIDSGLTGTGTGYYILKKNKTISIHANVFLRDSTSLGRGIGLYKTENCEIYDNYFGMIENVKSSVISSETKLLLDKARTTNRLHETSNQGYFMTGINVINSDKNTRISNNYFSFNKDITEVDYTNNTSKNNGYHRDHIIYAKEYDGLAIVGNYFKGMNKNADGGVKCRNGSNLTVYKNVFEDSMLLLYVQTASSKNELKNVLVKENVFLNLDYSTETVVLDGAIQKRFTLDYLILLKNYVSAAMIDSITITDNLIYSLGLANEEIRVDNTGFAMPTNVVIDNNKNVLNTVIKSRIVSTQNQANITTTNYTNGEKLNVVLTDEEKALDILSYIVRFDVDYIMKNKKLTSSGDIVVNHSVYANENMELGRAYDLYIVSPTVKTIIVEGQSNEVSSYNATIKNLQLEINLDANLEISLNREIDLSKSCKGFGYKDLELLGELEICSLDGFNLKGIKTGTEEIILSYGGFEKRVILTVVSNLISDFTVADINSKLSIPSVLDITYDKTISVEFVYNYDSSKFKLNVENLAIDFLETGEFDLEIIEQKSQIRKTVKIKVEPNVITYETNKQEYEVDEKFALTVYINGVVSQEYSITGLTYESGMYSSPSITINPQIVDNKDPQNTKAIELTFKHYYRLEVENTLFLVKGSKSMLKYSYTTSDNDSKVAYLFDKEYIQIDSSGNIDVLKSGNTRIKILLPNGEEHIITVTIQTASNNTWIWIVVAGGILIVGVCLVVVLRRKKYD